MRPSEKEALAKSLGAFVTKAIADATAPLLKRIDELEARKPEKGEKGDIGEAGQRGEAGATGERGPSGEKGEPGEKGDPGRDGRYGERGEKGADGRDGVGNSGAVIDRDGNLILFLTDGKTINLGPVVGKDGAPGEKGTDGRDGADGVGFDDMVVEHDGERTIALRFIRGEEIKEFAFSIPVVLDRGVYKADKEYSQGDAVTWGGSLWIAQTAAKGKPGESDGWRLAVKKGRDGRDGKDGDRGIPGIKGDPGRDLTHVMPNGERY